MRFKSQESDHTLPNIDLIPMLNVMMAVLAFFVLISMTLASAPEGLEIQLPSDEKLEPEKELQDKESQFLLITLKNNQEILIDETPLEDPETLPLKVKNYLEKDSERTVGLTAEAEVSYEVVMQTLFVLREVGGDRITLAIE